MSAGGAGYPLCPAAKWSEVETMSPSSSICGPSGLPWAHLCGSRNWVVQSNISSAQSLHNSLSFSALLQAFTKALLNSACATCIKHNLNCCLSHAIYSPPAATVALFPCTIMWVITCRFSLAIQKSVLPATPLHPGWCVEGKKESVDFFFNFSYNVYRRFYSKINSMANRWGNSGNSDRLYFLGFQNQCRWWSQPWN